MREVVAELGAPDILVNSAGVNMTGVQVRDMELAEWRRLGVTLAGGAALPRADMSASLVRGERRRFLVYGNYLALLDYNCSNSYAVSVGLLSDRLW